MPRDLGVAWRTMLPVWLRRLAYRVAYLGLRVYWFVAHPDSTGVKCVLTDGDRILLVRHTYGPRRWDLPGGSRSRGEDPQETASREMAEELGVAIESWTLVAELTVEAHHRRDHVHFFAAEVTAPELEVARGELAQVRWFQRDALPRELGQYARAIIQMLPEARSASGT